MADLVKKQQADLAARALIQVISKGKQTNLLPEEQLLHMAIGLKKMPHRSKRYHFIPLKHGLTESKTSEVCVLVKDGEPDLEKAIKEACPDTNLTVINISKLREEYQTHEAKRQLCASYDHFIADDRIVPLLPRVIGKRFYESKKNPVPVCLTRKSRGRKVLAALKTTVFQVTGTSMSVRVGHTDMTPTQIADNVCAAVQGVAPYIPGGAANIQSLHLRGDRTVALPLYSSAPTPEDEDLLRDVMPPAKRAKANGKAVKGGKSKGDAGDARKRKAGKEKAEGKQAPSQQAKKQKQKKAKQNGDAVKGSKAEGKTKKQTQKQGKKQTQQQQKPTVEVVSKAQENGVEAAAKDVSKKGQATPAKQQQASKAKKTPGKGKGQKKAAAAKTEKKEGAATAAANEEPTTPAPTNGKKKSKGKSSSGAASMPASALKAKKPKKTAQAKGEGELAAAASAPGSALKSKKNAKPKRLQAADSTPATPAKKTPAKKTPAKKQKKTPKRTR